MADKIRVLLTEEEVNKKISEVAAQINKDYEGKEVHLICILKGGVFFTCELAKRLTIPVSLDFMSVSSYGSDTKSSGVTSRWRARMSSSWRISSIPDAPWHI